MKGIAFFCPSVPGQTKAGKEHINVIPDNFYCCPKNTRPKKHFREKEKNRNDRNDGKRCLAGFRNLRGCEA